MYIRFLEYSIVSSRLQTLDSRILTVAEICLCMLALQRKPLVMVYPEGSGVAALLF